MHIELLFEDIADDIENAVADIWIEDRCEADAPAPLLFSTQIRPLNIRHTHPILVLDLEVPIETSDITPDLAMVFRVKGQTRQNQPVAFLNMEVTPVPKDLTSSVHVILSSIHS